MDFALVGEGRRSRGKHGRAKDIGNSCFSVIIIVIMFDVFGSKLGQVISAAMLKKFGPIPAPPVRNQEG